jgi:hypothetical protein
MATRKTQAQKSGAAKSSAAAAGTTKAGALPPYGVPIRDAIARGDAGEMKRVAASTRKYLRDLGAAVDKLDKALGKTKS